MNNLWIFIFICLGFASIYFAADGYYSDNPRRTVVNIGSAIICLVLIIGLN